MVDSTAISGRIISILMLDQSSQRRKMRLELAHLMQPRAKLCGLFLEVTTVLRCTVCKICVWFYFCVCFFYIRSPVLVVSFCVERIDLASKLRKFGPKWQWNRPFSAKKSPHKFSNTDPSNLIINKLTHFKQTFSLQTKKNYSTMKTFFTLFQISPNFEGTPLKNISDIRTYFANPKGVCISDYHYTYIFCMKYL